MPDDPQPQSLPIEAQHILVEAEDRAFEEYRAYIKSPEFIRKLCEHVKESTRRAIEATQDGES
jgi:hypothetical protein